MDLGNSAGGKSVSCVTIYTVERFEWLEIKAFCSKRTFCVKNDLLPPPLGEYISNQTPKLSTVIRAQDCRQRHRRGIGIALIPLRRVWSLSLISTPTCVKK